MPARVPVPADPPRGSRAAPLFWACLLIAAALYAPCVLANRIVNWSDLQQKYLRNQANLLDAQQQVHHLQQVADALETDPEFAAQVARAELGAAPASMHSQAIALPQELSSDPRMPPGALLTELPREAWYIPALRTIASDAPLRRNLLIAAAAVFLFGFLVFRESPAAGDTNTPRTQPPRLARTLFGRYLRDSDEVRKV
ncbi:MAG: hypothetical protein JNG89_15265 [Planctomycetaceae bacterium]|nr:hypothetical protein [Planctomycetaceae bacterium]